uniref:Uncharacterized protein KIAA0562like [Apis mellifera] n=1 Tax=Lepeophtheirus salmonis TaxID=72036 RepID=A0A0K2TJN3_LEPSM
MNNKLPRKKYVEPKGESLKNVKLKINDSVAKELSLAISVYGQERIAKSVNKHAIIRMEGSEEILKRFKSLRNNHSPHSSKKVFKATSDILMRLLKDLLIKIFRDGINLMMLLYNDFASRYSIPLDDLIYSAEESLFHLILKSSDVTNTKISVLSEGSIQNLIRIKSLHKSDEFQKTILRPLSEKATTGKDLPPKCDEMKAKIVLWYLQMQGRKELLPTRLVKRGTRFGVSAIQNVENKVKKQGKTILIILYKNNPDWVQDYVIQNISSSSRKSIIVRSLLQEMEGRHKSQ